MLHSIISDKAPQAGGDVLQKCKESRECSARLSDTNFTKLNAESCAIVSERIGI